jgi:GGDEF domain-containing protein
MVRAGARSAQGLLDKIERALAHATTDLGSSVALGGDQFLVVVPDRCFVDIAPLLLSAVRGARVFRRGWPRCVTASAGVASWPTHGETCGAAVAAAARALEIAKAAGGNRWAVAVDPSSSAPY